ncbi:Putative exported protein [Klebsiella pneumoniae IS33]|nr:Putative exported protein [Klebsiella pneumoniae IS33]
MGCFIPAELFLPLNADLFFLKGESDGLMHINGQAPETQKMTFLKQKDDFDNVMMQWMLPDAKTGRWLGLDYVKRNNKAILNVEVIRKNMDEPREFWTYDCRKVK